MVISNLDSQVDKVFGLSVPQKRDEQINQISNGKIIAASKSATQVTHEKRDAAPSTIHPQKLVERLDDTELPVWLL